MGIYRSSTIFGFSELFLAPLMLHVCATSSAGAVGAQTSRGRRLEECRQAVKCIHKARSLFDRWVARGESPSAAALDREALGPALPKKRVAGPRAGCSIQMCVLVVTVDLKITIRMCVV